ncbi:MAG: DNA-binding NtrC family response regulator [Pseudohongiellaceae bacterium]|jgi:DNA-binding NtrC family response regulator
MIGSMTAQSKISASQTPTPGVALALRDLAMRERIARLLEALNARSIDLPKTAGLSELSGVDVAIVDREWLPRRGLIDQDLPSGVTLVVLGSGDDASDEADLRAAGVTQSLDPRASDAELSLSLHSLLGAGAAGGLDGPEVHGRDVEPHLVDFASRSPRMLSFLDVVHRVADTDVALLITGETGVGKDRLARAIHADSSRADAAFVSVNVGALPENLLEDELFGHEAGAFTGADKVRKGRFETAEGGTIFLDEIGDLSPHLQVKLLTVLQRHGVQRLGGERPRPIDVRVMAATNRDLGAEVASGRFREDLFYRLSVVPLVVPPLRDRPEDIPGLAGRFLGSFREASGRQDIHGFTARGMNALLDHAWPGNVRELINAIERAVLLCRGRRIGLDDLPRALRKPKGTSGTAAAATSGTAADPGQVPEPAASATDDPFALPAECHGLPLREARTIVVERFERAYLTELLKTTGGRVGMTAELAGIAPRSLYDKLKHHGLRKEDFR